jgi:hypothetical protein
VAAGCIQQTAIPVGDSASTLGPISSPSSEASSITKFTLTPSNRKPTLYPGQIATMESKATQTTQAMNENCDGFSSIEYRMSDPQSLISIDGKWSAAYCIDPSSQLPYTRLIETGTGKSWDIPFYETFGAAHHDIKDGVLEVVHWSIDGQYAYLDAYFCCLDGPGMMFVNTYGLYRIDLNNGKLQEMLPEAGAVAFSPNGRYLAGNDYLKNVLHVYDLTNNFDRIIPIDEKYSQTGLLAWSPNSSKIVLVAALPNWEDTLFAGYAIPTVTPEPKQDGFSILLIDVNTNSLITLIDDDPRLVRPYQPDQPAPWISNSEILLLDSAGNGYILNIETNQLSTAPTATLNP